MIYTARYAVTPSELERPRFDLAADITRQVVQELRRVARSGDVHVEWVAQCAHPARNGEFVDVPWVPGTPFPLRVRNLLCRGRVETRSG
jgi:hypothetical protein